MPPTGPTRTRTVWTAEEDARLLQVARDSAPHKWSEIAKALPGRTALQCRQRWLNSLDPSIKKGPWTEEEDMQLTALHAEHGDSWATICKAMVGRTSQQCRYRWVSSLNPTLNLGAWTDEEDETLARLHGLHGNAWSKIANQMHGRTDLQCRYRWVFCLDPSIGKVAWTKEEDAALHAMYRKYGTSWTKIANQIPGRTYHQCRYRWTTFLGSTARKRARPAEDGAASEERDDNTVPTSPETQAEVGSPEAAGATGAPLRVLSGNVARRVAEPRQLNTSSGAIKKRFLKRWVATKTIRQNMVAPEGTNDAFGTVRCVGEESSAHKSPR